MNSSKVCLWKISVHLAMVRPGLYNSFSQYESDTTPSLLQAYSIHCDCLYICYLYTLISTYIHIQVWRCISIYNTHCIHHSTDNYLYITSYTYTYISFISFIPYVLYPPVIQNRRHHQSNLKRYTTFTRPRTDDYCRIL